ncbi:MAG: LamG domain-containing protein [Patescibacteria group bacterium]|nr:LamG domain-containing protein [Patescibacteria group bacterium]
MRQLVALSSALLAVVAVGVAVTAEASLIHYWDFNQTGGTVATDLVGSLDVTLSASNAQLAIDPMRGDVLSLTGGHASNLGVPFTSDMDHTTMGWVYHINPQRLRERYISWGTSSGRYFIGPHGTGGAEEAFSPITAGVGGGATASLTVSDASPLRGQWQHWALVREGNNTTLYRSGNPVQTVTATGGSIAVGDGLQIGRQFAGGETLQGMLDDLAIYRTSLTQSQIQNAMNLGPTQYAHRASHYKLDGDLLNSVAGEPDGTAGGTGPLQFVPGAMGDGVAFNGTNRIELTGGRPNADGGLRTGSVAFWVNTTTDARADVMGNANSGSNTLFRVELNTYNESHESGRLYTIVRADEGNELRLSTATADHSWRDGEWHHVAFAWDTTTASNFGSIYIDGVPQGIWGNSYNNILPADVFTAWQNPMFLGAGNNRGTSVWNPLPSGTALDDVGMWDGRLDDRRVAAMAGLGRFSGVDMSSPAIDNVLMLESRQVAVAGGDAWHYTTDFAVAADGTSLVAGRNYQGVDGFNYIILSGTSSNFTGVTTAPFAPPNLISHYRFDGNLLNSVASEPGGTGMGSGALTYVPGAIDEGVRFGGANQIDLSTDGRPNADAGLHAGSLAFWISTTADTRHDVMGSANTGSSTLFRVGINAFDTATNLDQVSLGLRSEEGRLLFLGTTAATDAWKDGDWHHVAFAWDTTAGALDFGSVYIDGVLQKLDAGSKNDILLTDTFADWANAMTLGAWSNRGTMTGRLPSGTALDDVGMWDGRLDDRRVAAMAGLGRFSNVELASTDIDGILALQPGHATVAGSDLWWHTTEFVAPLDGGDLVAGRNYLGIDGFNYIILSGTAGNFVGVTTIPEPGSAALLGVAFLGLLVWRRTK